MSNLMDFAKREMKLAKLDKVTQQQVLEKMRAFAEEGHSGASAAYSIASMRPRTKVDRIFRQLASFTPLTPITSAPSEWTLVDDSNGKLYQHRRAHSVFKLGRRAYDIDDKPVYVDKDGFTFTSSTDQPKTITFPYDVAAARERFRRRKPKLRKV